MVLPRETVFNNSLASGTAGPSQAGAVWKIFPSHAFVAHCSHDRPADLPEADLSLPKSTSFPSF